MPEPRIPTLRISTMQSKMKSRAVGNRYRRQARTEIPVDIFTAAANGDLDTVKRFVNDQHVDVNERVTGSGETPLFKAAQGGHMNVIEFLINNGADIKHTDRWGYNVLIWAVDSNEANIQLIQYLINNGAEINLKDKRKGYTALHWAADHGRLDTIRLLVDRGAEFNTATNDGKTPLDIAAINGQLDVVTYFLEEKKLNYHGDVFRAASSGYLGILKYLIERKGAKIAQTDNVGQTLVHKAAKSGMLEVVKYLIDKGIDYNVRGEYKNTPLHTAAFGGHLPVVKYLVEEKHVDIKVKNINGNTPLHDAALNGKVEIVKYFLEERGMDLYITGDYGNTPLHMAAYKGQLPVVKYLVEERKANIETRNSSLNTPVHDAVLNDRLEIVKFLLGERNADINSKGQWGNTALHWAAHRGYLAIIKYLVEERRANLNLQNNDGNVPLHDAVASGNLEVVKYFVEKGADINAKNYRGISPTMAATQAGNTNIAKYLQTAGGTRRKRRNVDADPSSTHPETGSASSSACKPSSFVIGIVHWITNSVAGFLPPLTKKTSFATYPEISNSFVDGVLILLDVGVRKFTGLTYKQSIHDSLLSPAEIIQRKIDSSAANVLSSISDCNREWRDFPSTSLTLPCMSEFAGIELSSPAYKWQAINSCASTRNHSSSYLSRNN